MKKKRHNADQIMKILGESEGSKSAAEICRSYEISEQTLYRWKRKYGVPKRTRSDNGPEFAAKAIGAWLKKADICSVYKQPGSPWENPHAESFHSRFRNDCLNREWFLNLLDARNCIETLLEQYNTEAPTAAFRTDLRLKYTNPKASPRSRRSLAISNNPLPIINPSLLSLTF
jgi:transposase InsO family protein